MNKPIFSRGGMPVYLDDLSLLLSLPEGLWTALFSALVGGEPAVLTAPCTTTRTAVGGTPVTHVPGGTLLTAAHGVLSWETADVPGNGEVWLNVYTETSDPRTFEDGQIRDCRSECFLRAEAAQGSTGFALSGLRTLVNVIGSRSLADYTMPAVWKNGYQGALSYDANDGMIYLTAAAPNTDPSWSEYPPLDNFTNRRGLIATVDNKGLYNALSGKRARFSYLGNEYAVYFAPAPNTAGTLLLKIDGVPPSSNADYKLPRIAVTLSVPLSSLETY